MLNAKTELLELAGDETIEAIVLGRKGWDDGGDRPLYFPKNMVKEGLAQLDFDFDDGYGGENGYSLYAWTKTKVIIKSHYDGSESYETVPRNPENILPRAYGGG